MFQKLKSFPWGYLLFAVLLGCIGGCFLGFCDKELLPTGVLVIGIALTVFAIVYGVVSLSLRGRGVNFFFRMAFAILALLGGVITIIFYNVAVEVVITVIGLLLVIDGSFKLQTTVHLKHYRSFFWWVMLAVSLVPILGGFFLTKFYATASADAKTLSVFLGLTIVVDAVGNLLSAFSTPFIEKGRKTEILSETLPDTKDAKQ